MCEVSTFEQAVHLTLNAISLHKAISRFFAYRGTGIGPDDFISVMRIYIYIFFFKHKSEL